MSTTTDERTVGSMLRTYFEVKNRAVVDETMAFFSPDLVTYTDSTLGWTLDGWDTLKAVFTQYMPNWGDGASLPIRITGAGRSAVVEFVDTPELFGGELHILGAVDLEDGRIVRWVDFWDSTRFDRATFDAIATPDAAFPARLAPLEGRAEDRIASAARGLHHALSGSDPAAVAALLAPHVVLEDFAAGVRIVGRVAVVAAFEAVLPVVPYGVGSTFDRALGGGTGGGFEWTAPAGGPVRYGLTALELGDDDRVLRIAVAYDGGRLDAAERTSIQDAYGSGRTV